MTASLNLNLSDALNTDELRELVEFAETEHKPIERVLYEAAKAFLIHKGASPSGPARRTRRKAVAA